MSHSEGLQHRRLREFFDWATRRSFWDLNVRERPVTEYISGVLVDFARSENLYKIRTKDGRALDTVVELLAEAQEAFLVHSDVTRERAIKKHVGDYVLFMAGLFYEYTNRLGLTSYYVEEGARAYQSVGEIDLACLRPGSSLFLELSRRFELYVAGLNYLRSLFFKDKTGDPFEDLSRGLSELI